MNDYPVLVKSYNMTLWYIKKIEKLPKNHRYTLGERVQNECLDLLMLLSETIYSKDKKRLLIKANQSIEKLRLLTKLMEDLKILSKDNERFILDSLNEIGAMIGGWLKKLRMEN